MGCDIHLYVEKKENNTWEAVKGPNPIFIEYTEKLEQARKDNLQNKIQEYTERLKDEEKEDYYWLSHWRHYDSFAVLCGVRNYSNVTPITEPRGFPDNASDIVKESYECWEEGHSASWLTLHELISVDWNSLIKSKYYLPKHISEAKLKGEEPFMVLHTRNTASDVFFEEEMKLSEFAYVIPKIIQSLQKIGELDQVRIVFWFDN